MENESGLVSGFFTPWVWDNLFYLAFLEPRRTSSLSPVVVTSLVARKFFIFKFQKNTYTYK